MDKKTKEKAKRDILKFLIKNPLLLRGCLYFFHKRRLRNTKYKYFFYQNILLEDYKAIYFPIPKAGSSSMKKIFCEILEVKGEAKLKNKFPEYYNYRNFPYVKKEKILKKYSNYFRFTFVRNPWDRLVSCYKNWVRDDFKERYLIYGFKEGMSFEEFVKAVCKIPDEVSEGHFRSQHTFIVDKRGRLLTNFIGKIENFEKYFKDICDKINLKYVKVSPENERKDKHYSKYYTEKTKKMVENRFKTDIELFQYNFEEK